MRQVDLYQFKDLINSLLVGANVSDVKSGPGTGSVFNIHLSRQVENIYLMVFCPWKLVLIDDIRCSWRDPEDFIHQELSQIEGNIIIDVSLELYGDISIRFSSGLTIKIFSDCSHIDDCSIISDYFIEVNNSHYVCFRGKFYID